MSRLSLKTATISLLAVLAALLPMGCSGSDGAAGPPGKDAGSVIDVSTASDSEVAALDVVSTVTSVTIASPPVLTFSMTTADKKGIVGLAKFWQADHNFVRFTFTKLVTGQNGDPDSWVAYVRSNGAPTYDNGASLVDHGDGTYTFTFKTDVTAVAGVTYEPTLTHRVAGQIGNYGMVPLEEQNLWLDFVPNASPVTRTRNIAVVASCNECHDKLVIHGRRFEVEYCVTCHNPDLAETEGSMSFMVHRIHAAGKFAVLDDAVSYEEVTYPQDVLNCRKCHNADDTQTPQANNWRTLPNMVACDGCHDVFNANAKNTHTGGPQTNNAGCVGCHSADQITAYHTTPNSTPNNPELLPKQRKITYEMISAAVDSGTGDVTIKFKVLSDGTPLDLTSLATLPADLKNSTTGYCFNTPALLLAWALPQGSITAPADYNNLGRASAQPPSLSLCQTSASQTGWTPHGTLAFDAPTGVMTATITTAASKFPTGATLRAVGLQGYFQQDLDLPLNATAEASLHAIAAVAPVTGDAKRREVVDSAKCGQCHEWFEGHGGNRVYNINICTMCHVPNLSSSGRELTAYFTAPEDSQNLKDMIHGIHSSAFRTRDYEHVRNRSGGIYYNWSEVTFPAETNNCTLCHKDGTYDLPLADGVLPTTVRTTGVANGLDANPAAVTAARAGTSLPNATDWVNTPTASSCFYCHTSDSAYAHMVLSGAQLSHPLTSANAYTNRSVLGSVEACVTCHGAGKSVDVTVVHGR